MSAQEIIQRLASFCRKNGLRATMRRGLLTFKRASLANRMVLFYCALNSVTSFKTAQVGLLTVERKETEEALDPADLGQILNFWNPTILERRIRERFQKGASLWLVKSDGKLAGYGWTFIGRTIEPHFFPLGKDDVHLFDFLVFPEFRGQGINPFLVCHI